MNDFLDRFTSTHRSKTFASIVRFHERINSAADLALANRHGNPPPLPYAESMFILKYGKKAYRTWLAAGRPAYKK